MTKNEDVIRMTNETVSMSLDNTRLLVQWTKSGGTKQRERRKKRLTCEYLQSDMSDKSNDTLKAM